MFVKNAIKIAGITALLPLIVSAGAAGQGPPPIPNAEDVYHNIRYLKGIPYEQFIPSMYMFAESLGVECDYCHEAKRESDAKPTKRIAGQMFQMMQRLNEESFGGDARVTCFTCHRGNAQPARIPMLTATPNIAPASDGKRIETLPTVESIVGKYIAAIGGDAALQKIASRVETGTVSQDRLGTAASTHKIEAVSETPGKRITKGFSVTHLGNSPDAYGVYSGDYGWVREGSGPVREMWRSRLDAAKLEDTLNFPVRLKEWIRGLKVESPEEVEGRKQTFLPAECPRYLW